MVFLDRHVRDNKGLNFEKLVHNIRTDKEHGKMRFEIFNIKAKVRFSLEQRKGIPCHTFKMNNLWNLSPKKIGRRTSSGMK